MRRILTSLAVVSLIFVFAGCSSGPGQGFNPEGNYSGFMSGAFSASIAFTVSGNSIEGTGTVSGNNFLRGKSGTTHLILSGSRDGIDINSTLTAIANLEVSLDNGSTWQDIPEKGIIYNGKFTETGAVVAAVWQGDYIAPNTQPIGGVWGAERDRGQAGGIIRP